MKFYITPSVCNALVTICGINRLVFIFVFIIFISCNAPAGEETIATKNLQTTHSVKLSDLEGQPFSLAQFEGKVVFLNFWAPWCKPCITEMPSIANAQKMLGDKVIFVLASPEDAGETASFRNSNKYAFRYTLADNMESLGVQALPATYIFSAEGILSFSESGARKWDDSANIRIINQIIKQ